MKGEIAMKEVKLYDSKSKKLVTLQPREEGKVNVYFCGPTVYNHAHVGNVRPMIVFDNLRRKYGKSQVRM